MFHSIRYVLTFFIIVFLQRVFYIFSTFCTYIYLSHYSYMNKCAIHNGTGGASIIPVNHASRYSQPNDAHRTLMVDFLLKSSRMDVNIS
jgi:hypothetical protein